MRGDFSYLEQRLVIKAVGSQRAGSSGDVSGDARFSAQDFRIRRSWNADILLRREEVAETLWPDLNGT